jgi:hypothetical protein
MERGPAIRALSNGAAQSDLEKTAFYQSFDEYLPS